MDAVGGGLRAGLDPVQEHDLTPHLFDGGFIVPAARQHLHEARQLVVVGGEEREGLHVVVQVLGDGPGEAHPVVGRGAASYLVQDDQRAFGRAVQNACRFGHLHHEGRLTTRQPVLGPDPREDAVDDAQGGLVGGDIGAGLGQQGDEGHLPEVDGLAGHVRARDDLEPRVPAHLGVVGDEGHLQVVLDDGMPPTGDPDAPPFHDFGATVAQFGRRGGERGDHIHDGYGARDLLQFRRRLLDGGANLGEDAPLDALHRVARPEHPRFVLLQLHRYVAGVVLERLAVLVAFGDRTRLLARYLYKVALSVPVAHLQSLQARLQALLGLEARQPMVGAVPELARLVELPRVAGAYDLTALLRDRSGDELPHPWRLLHGPQHPREQRGARRYRPQRLPEGSDLLQRASKREQIVGGGRKPYDASGDALHVGDATQMLAHILAQHVVSGEHGDGPETLPDAAYFQQRTLQPPPERGRASAAQRGEVLDQGPSGAGERRVPVDPVSLETGDPEVPLQGLLPRGGLERPARGRAHRGAHLRQSLGRGPLGDDDLARRPPLQLGRELLLGDFGARELPCRSLDDGYAGQAVPDHERGQVVGLPRGEDIVLDDGAGRQNAGDLTRELLGFRRID